MEQKKETLWLGIVPKNWQETRIGSVYVLRNIKVSDRDYKPLSVTKQGVLPQLENVAKTNAHDDRKLVKIGDFVINSRSDRRGSCGISNHDGSVSLINTVLSPRDNMNNTYFNWLFHTDAFADEFYKWGHGIVDDLWTTTWQDMKNIDIIVPPLSEQQAIAEFLDRKCGEIDEIAKLIEEQIETLENYKRRVICETINKSPKETTKLKYIATSYNSNIKAGDLNLEEGKTLVYGASGEAGFYHKNGIPEKYIGIIKDGAGVGRNNIYPKDTLLVGTMAYIFPKQGININWLNYAIMSLSLSETIDKTTIPHIYFSEYGNKTLPFPPLSEQQAIAVFLDRKCGEIDEIITAKQKQLETLGAYKQSMIYEYVTGKKEVTNA